MQRGDVVEYIPVLHRPRISTARLIVSSSAINDSELPWVIGVQVVEDDPDSLLAPSIGEHGWALVTTVERIMRGRIGEQLGVATPEEMHQLDVGLRAALDL